MFEKKIKRFCSVCKLHFLVKALKNLSENLIQIWANKVYFLFDITMSFKVSKINSNSHYKNKRLLYYSISVATKQIVLINRN